MPARMTTTSNDDVIVSDLGGDKLFGMAWDASTKTLNPTGWELHLDVGIVSGLAYVERHKLIVVVGLDAKCINAFQCPSGALQWKLHGSVAGKPVRPRGICCDQTTASLYVADYQNERVLVLDARSGRVREVVLKNKLGIIYDVSWNTEQPHLVVKHGQDQHYQISLFNVHSKEDE